MGCVQEGLKILQRAVAGMDGEIVGDVVSIIPQRGSKKRQQPDAGNAEFLQVVQLAEQSLKVADAVVVGIFKCLDVQFVNNGVFKPERVEGAAWLLQRGVPRGIVHKPQGQRPILYFSILRVTMSRHSDLAPGAESPATGESL